MAIKFSCPHCNRPLNVKNELAGKRGPCPACKKIIAIPTPASGGAKAAPRALTFEDLERAAAAAFAEPSPPPQQQPQARPIQFSCPHCDTVVTVGADLEGKQTPCSNPECRRIIKVPLQKKQQPLDWRKPDEGLPSLARRDAPVAPEGAWGNVAASTKVSEEALEQAGVIIEEREPTPISTWVYRGLILASVLVLAAAAIWWGTSSLSTSRRSKLFDRAMAGVDADKPRLGAENDAAVFTAASEYVVRSEIADPAKEARDHLRRARSLLVQLPPSLDRDRLLIDVALAEVDLGGSEEQAAKGRRLRWDEVQKELLATIAHLGRVFGPPRSSPYGPRAEALQLICRKLLDLQQVQVAYSLAAAVGNEKQQVGDPGKSSLPGELPEAVGIAGLEFLRAGQNAQAKQLADSLLRFQPGSGEARFPDAPAAAALVLAAGSKEFKDMTEPPADPARRESYHAGKAIDAARSKDLDKAKELAEKVSSSPEKQFDALLAIAEAGKPDAALKLAEDEAKNGTLSAWQLLRLARAAPGPRMQSLSTGDDESLGAWIQFEVVSAKLADAAPEPALADGIPEGTTPRAIARLQIVRRAAARGTDMVPTVDAWKDSLKPFGYLGIALGLQDREKK